MSACRDATGLFVALLGRPAAWWRGAPLPLRREGLLLLCHLAELGRPAPRAELAALLWGPGRLADLRQELAALRRLPGAGEWLVEDGAWVRVVGTTDVGLAAAALAAADRAAAADLLGEAPLLEGLEDGGLPALGDRIGALLDRVAALRRASRGPAAPPAAGAAVAQLLAAAGEPVPLAVLARALELPAWAVADALAGLPLAADGGWAGPPADPASRALLAPVLARAWREVEGPGAAVAARLAAAGLPEEAAVVWLGLAEAGDFAAAEAAVAHARSAALRGAALRRAGELALRRGEVDTPHVDALSALALAEQDPALLLAAAGLRCRRALARDDDPSLGQAASGDALGERDGAARMLNHLGASLEREGRAAEALACFGDAAALAAQLPDRALGLVARANLAELQRRAGRLGACRAGVTALLREALPARILAQVWQTRAALELSCGRREEAARGSERAAERWRDADEPVRAAYAERFAALAAGLPDAAAFDALAASVAALPRPDVARHTWTELALHAPDGDRARRAAAGADPLGGRVACARFAPDPGLAAALDAVPEGLAPVEVTLGLALLGDPRADARLAAQSVGLLGAQAEALAARVAAFRRAGVARSA